MQIFLNWQILDILPCLYLLLLMIMPPRSFNHVAVSATDIDYAMRWYEGVIQMTVLIEPTEIAASEEDNKKNHDPHLAKIVKTIFGSILENSRFAL
jgi:hypothetical protein